jgi:hypothetical protein
MSKPISEPLAPPQQDQETYSPTELALFKEYTRESYRTAFGVDAPPWDPSRLTKTWFDSTVDASKPGSTVAYKIFGQDLTGAWGLQDMTLAAADAASVNLPGAIQYPPYVIAPTGATRGGSPINPAYLSTESDARTLMAMLGGTALVNEGEAPVFPVVYPADEPRRMWAIVLRNSHQMNAGLFLQARNAQGVGSPGHWETSSDGYPVWSADPPAPTGINDTRPHRAVPVRNLLPNERIGMGPLGFGANIVRVDLEQQRLQQEGRFMPGDRQKLEEIYRIVSKLGI